MWNKAEIYDGDDGGGKASNCSPSAVASSCSPSAVASPKRLIPHDLHAKISRIIGYLNAARKVINEIIIISHSTTQSDIYLKI